MHDRLDARQEVEQQYQRIVELATEGIWTADVDSVTTFVNPAMARMLGYTPDEMIGRPAVDFLDEAGKIALAERTERRRLGFTDRNQDFMFVHREGHPVWTMVSATPLTGPTGEHAGSLALITDITQRREAEEALVTSERRFRAVVQNATDVVNIADTEGVMTYTSPSMERVLGYAPQELIGTQARDLMHPDDVERVEQTVAEQWAGGKEEPIEYRVRHRDGSWRIVNALIVNLFDEPTIEGVVGTMWDVTEQVETKAALALTLERYAALARYATDLVTVSGPDGLVQYLSPSVQWILGYEPEELIGTSPAAVIHPEDAASISKAILESATEGTDPPLITYRVRHRDGSWRTLESTTTNLLDEPSVCGMVTNSRDVTERRVAEQKAAQLTAILEASNEVVVLSDPSGQVVYANRAARHLLGEQEHQQTSELSSPSTRERLRTEIMPIVRDQGVWSGELELVGRDGVSVPVAGTVQAHHDEDGKLELVSTIAHDISELKTAQRRLEHEATHDALTGLANRVLFREMGERAIARASRSHEALAVLFLDLDGFKLVNDSFGHDVGDQLLAQVALRLRDAVRMGDTVARLGGDEFVVLCEHPGSEEEVVQLSQRLIALVSQPFWIQGHEVRVGASVGIAHRMENDSGIADLIREADIALYRAKHEGRGRAEMFDDSIREH